MEAGAGVGFPLRMELWEILYWGSIRIRKARILVICLRPSSHDDWKLQLTSLWLVLWNLSTKTLIAPFMGDAWPLMRVIRPSKRSVCCSRTAVAPSLGRYLQS